MAFTVKCPLCGEIVSGDTEDALVEAANAHGNDNHGMTVPREMVIANARET